MKSPITTLSLILSLLLTTATPVLGVPLIVQEDLETRQTSDTSNDLVDGPCKDVFLIFARGSTEPGNMVCVDVSCFKCTLWRSGLMKE